MCPIWRAQARIQCRVNIHGFATRQLDGGQQRYGVTPGGGGEGRDEGMGTRQPGRGRLWRRSREGLRGTAS